MHRLRDPGKFIVLIAALSAVGASLLIFFTPQTITIESSTTVANGTGVVERFTQKQSWYQAQGLWGSLVLVLFAGFYLLAYRSSVKGNFLALAIMSIVGIALTFVSGFSIGPFYLPAAVGLFIGMLLMVVSRNVPPRSKTSNGT